MKVPGLLLWIFLLCVGVSAQTPVTPAPDLTVIKKNWRKEIHNPALTADPFRSNDEQAELQRAQKDNAVRNAVRVREGGTPLPTNRVSRPMESEPEGPTARFVYRVTVKNTGTKTITALTWDYLFFDSEGVEQVGQHTFRQRVKIAPGKSVELIGHSSSPPTRVVDAGKTHQEDVSIRLIEYADGSFWQRPLH